VSAVALRGRVRAAAVLAVTAVAAVIAGGTFRAMHAAEPIVPGEGVTATRLLSEFAPDLAGGPGDTPVYELAGAAPGGVMAILGGTHPREVSGLLAAVIVIENARVAQGKLVVVPQTNRSGFSHTEPLEGLPHRLEIETAGGTRWFRNGMRLSNPVHQWPDPDIHVHHPSGEGMIGHEARNLNRNYPGNPRGPLTARIGAGVTAMLRAEGADLVLDMHEANPENPVVNRMVAHERAFEVAAYAALGMQAAGAGIDLVPSARNLRGLSHREFGDHTGAYAVLTETANPSQGRFRGRTDASLVIEGRDPNYVRAAALGRLFVGFDEAGHPLSHRVARQLAAIRELIAAYGELHPDRAILVEGIPEPDAVIARGLGAFLRPPPEG
jgi:hypothetical protein